MDVTGSELISLINSSGGVFEPGVIRTVPATLLATGQATQGYRLPSIAQVAVKGTLWLLALPWRVRLNQQVRMGELTLMVCEPREGDNGGGHECYEFADLRIGEKAETFSLESLTISALQDSNSVRVNMLEAVDRVDISQVLDPQSGSDGRAEVQITNPGAVIKFNTPCKEVELHYYNPGPGRLVIRVSHVDGSNTEQVSETPANRPAVVTIDSASGISSVQLQTDGMKSFFLYRICCEEQTPETPDVGKPSIPCIDMSKLKPDTKLDEVKLGGVIFRDPRGDKVLLGFKASNQLPARMSFSNAGLQIELPRAASSVRLHLLVEKGAEYKIEALNSVGKPTTGEGGKASSSELRLTLNSDGIRQLLIKAEGAAALVEICVTEAKATLIPIRNRLRPLANNRADLIATAETQTDATRFPVVEGHNRQTGERANWPGQIISSHPRKDGGVCHIVRYATSAAPQSVDEVSVKAVAIGREVTFVGLCAIDDRAADWHEHDEIIKGEIDTNNGKADPTDGRPIVLEPGTVYRVEVEWSYQTYQSKEENEQPPTNPDSEAWIAGGVQSYRFATASEDTAIPTRQDGPNEHVFDPRDLDRYLADSAPANGANHHFTEDPVVFHFTQNHVDNLIERYGRDWDIEVRRTDPPPVSGGVPGQGQRPLTGILSVLLTPLVYLTPADQRITEAAKDAPCISNDRPVGGTSLAGQFPLEPNVMYDANLWAVRKDDATDRASVSAANFRTSRYANPTQMIEALGLEVGTAAQVAPVPPPELILEAGVTLPIGVEPASDRAMDSALNDMGLGTLGLPKNKARLFQIWQPDGAGTLRLVAILIDALEPMNRTAHIKDGNEIRIEERCALRDGRLSGVRLDVVRLSRNSTRALLMPSSPLPQTFGPNSFQLRFDTSDGLLVGRRRVRTRPLVLELEGF